MKIFKLIIPCYFENEQSIQNDKLELDSDITIYDIRDITLYEKPIAIAPYLEKGKVLGTRIVLNNDYFISNMSIDEIEILIDLELSL